MQLKKILEIEGKNMELLTSRIDETELKLEEGSYESIPYLNNFFVKFFSSKGPAVLFNY